MKIISKAFISLFISTLLFTAFTLFSYHTLFDLIESNFFNQKVINEIESRLIHAEEGLTQYKKERNSVINELSMENSIKNSFLVNQSSEDIFRRNNLIQVIKNNLLYFDFLRITDNEGKIHFSNNENDIREAEQTRIMYKRFEETSEQDINIIINEYNEKNIFYDKDSESIIFVSSVNDNFGIERGYLLVYFSEEDLYRFLLSKNYLETSSVITFVGNYGFAINLFENNDTNIAILEEYWRELEIRNLYPLFVDDQDKEFSIITREIDSGYAGYVLLSSALHINTHYKYIILVSAFIIILILTFLMFNLRQDKITVIADRIKRFQINLLIEYLEQKSDIEWKKWKKELESRKEEVRKEFKRGIRGIKGEKEVLVNSLIDKSWDEIIGLLAGHLEQKTAVVSAVSSVKIENIEEIIRAVISKEKELLNVKPALAVKRAAEAVEVEELEELDELDEAEAAEAVEVEELEELDEAEAVEAVEVEELEELEELEEAEAADYDEITEAASLRSASEEESKKFKELIARYKDFGEEVIAIEDVIKAFTEIEKNIIPVNDGEDEEDLKKLKAFISSYKGADYSQESLKDTEYTDLTELGELQEIEEIEEIDEISADSPADRQLKQVESTENLEFLESVPEFVQKLEPIPEEKLEYLEKAEIEDEQSETPDEETIVYISDIVSSSLLNNSYAAESLFDEIRKKRIEELSGLSGESDLYEVTDLEYAQMSTVTFTERIKILEKEKLLEIKSLKELDLEFEDLKDNVVVEKDGVLEIREDLYKSDVTEQNELKNLIEQKNEPVDSFGYKNVSEFIIGEDIDLPVFSDMEKNINIIDKKVIKEYQNSLNDEYGFDFDEYINNGKGDKAIASMKGLMKITREIGSHYGVILVKDANGFKAEISAGLNTFTRESFQFSKNEAVYINILNRKKVFFLKTEMDKVKELFSLFSENDYNKLSSCLLLPLKFNNNEAYMIASPDLSRFTLKDLIAKVKNLQK